MGKSEVTVQPGLYTFDTVDEQRGLQRMSSPGRRDSAKRVERGFHVNNSLGTPAEEGKFFDCQRITGIATDRPALFNCSAEIQCTYLDV
jgi:hypothetical protein